MTCGIVIRVAWGDPSPLKNQHMHSPKMQDDPEMSMVLINGPNVNGPIKNNW